MKLEEKIFTLRKKNGYSQEDLAYKLNVSRQTISKWETGITKPDTDNIIMMSKLFDISLDSLLIDDISLDEVTRETTDAIEDVSSNQAISNGSKHKKNKLMITGIVMSVISLIGVIAVIVISLMSKTSGDITVLYTTMYMSLKTIFIILIITLAVGVAILISILALYIYNKHKENHGDKGD